jgi:transposase InsO family protein
VLEFQRSSCYYRSMADEQAALRIRIRDLAQTRVSYGYRRIHVLLEREGWKVNHKRVYRLYKQEGLVVRAKRPRRHVSAYRRKKTQAAQSPNESWFLSIDDAREKVEQWRLYYNGQRPHSALGNLAPMEFVLSGEAIS